jgi:hypothetical protein
LPVEKGKRHHVGMPADTSHPHGEVFLDARGEGRALRLTWHHEADVVVLSLWRDQICAGTFRLSAADVSDFVDALIEGLRDGPADDAPASEPPPVVPYPGAMNVVQPDDGDADDGVLTWALRGDGGRASA